MMAAGPLLLSHVSHARSQRKKYPWLGFIPAFQAYPGHLKPPIPAGGHFAREVQRPGLQLLLFSQQVGLESGAS